MLLRKNLPKICIALGQADPSRLLELARHEASCGERFLEFRLDYLARPAQGAALIADFLKEYPECSILATCRRHQNHGRFNGSIEQQLIVLTEAIARGAKAVDVEIESAELALQGVRDLAAHATLVVSYHNYEGTPAMEPVLRRMLKVPADAYKIVTTARKPSDNLRLLALSKSVPKTPLILLAMTEMGFPSRVLSLAGGGLYTYAAPSVAEGTAAGQVCARSLRQFYRCEKLSRNTKVFGVIADPVQHSISPAVHNRALQSRRVDAVYLPFLVAPLQLKDFFLLADKLPITGFSVTIPHKQRVIRYLDAVDSLARRIGAVNTVWKKAGKWRGANTDANGVRVPLEKRLKLGKASVLVAGNGGAARSAVFALADAGAQVFVTGRNPDRVRALAKVCGGTAVAAEHVSEAHYDVLVHATPVGMWPETERCYFEGKIPADVVFDLVYNPHDTLLLRRAREQGCEVIHGIEMFVEQASAQFQLFTGVAAPRQAMERAAVEALASHAINHRGECE